MGCDIHSMAEVRLKRFKKGDSYYNKWFAVGHAFKAKQYGKQEEPPMIWYPREEGEFDTWETNEIMTVEPYEGRNYSLFALLADVRNYNDTEPISKPKGVPKDASEQWKAYVAYLDSDGHSHSYLTYRQLVKHLEKALTNEGAKDGYLDLLHNLQHLYWKYPGVKEVRFVFCFDN